VTSPTSPAYEQTPKPVPGCKTCASWEQERRRAETSGDLSRAIDCRIEIRRHASHGV